MLAAPHFSVLQETHLRERLILSVIQAACDTLRVLQRSRSLAACSGSRRTVIASRGVSLGLRPAPFRFPPALIVQSDLFQHRAEPPPVIATQPTYFRLPTRFLLGV